MKRVFSLLLVIVLAAGLLCGCSGTKVFTKNGLSLTLPAYYQDLTNMAPSDLAFLYGFRNVAISGVTETKEGLEDYMDKVDLPSYGQLIIAMNGFDCELVQKEGIYSFIYEADVDGTAYTYLSAVFESADSFWTVQTYCPTELYAQNADGMWSFLKSVTIE